MKLKQKDLFIDTNIAKNFANPLDADYKKLILWLQSTGTLAISQKLLVEYQRTCGGYAHATNMVALIAHLTKVGRLNKISSQALRMFQFTKAESKRLRSNQADHEHLKLVLLSDRKMGIVRDHKLCEDINGFRKIDGIQPQAAARPQDIPYQ